MKGVRIRDEGTGDPAILFVHGFSGSLDDYAAQFEGLASRLRCIAVDMPGHGGSATLHEPSIASVAAMVNSVKAQSGARRVILAGHSMGTKVIREAYRQSSEGVAGLLLIDGSTSVGPLDVQVSRMREQIHTMGYPVFARRMFAECFFEGADPQLRVRTMERAARLDPVLAEALLVDSIRWELTGGADALGQIAVPLLLLQSTYFNAEFRRAPLQPGMTTPFMKLLTQTVTGARTAVIPDVGHFPMIEAAEAVNRLILDFATRTFNNHSSGE